MVSLNECVSDFAEELKKGKIQKAYKGIFDFLTKVKTNLLVNNPEFNSSGSMYHGYLDMSYFPIVTEEMKKRKLKIAVVFNYELFQLEVWLSGSNRAIQKKYWELLKKRKWNKYSLVKDIEKSDSIIEYVLRTEIDLEQEEEIKDIGTMIKTFIHDVEIFLKQERILE